MVVSGALRMLQLTTISCTLPRAAARWEAAARRAWGRTLGAGQRQGACYAERATSTGLHDAGEDAVRRRFMEAG